jgi:hypothetical protein
MKQLFQYTVLLHEYTEKEGKKEFKDTKIIIEPKFELAKNEKDLVFKITREIPAEFATEPDNIQILIRNF